MNFVKLIPLHIFNNKIQIILQNLICFYGNRDIKYAA